MTGIKDELARIQRFLTDEPSGEANTCNRVIFPVLLALGYDFVEIEAEGVDAAGGKPDYALLPDTSYTWYLEAKAWKEALQEKHAVQAINYAHSAGARWVVLTNGRVWRLYDDSFTLCAPADRLVAEATVEDPGALEGFLLAIGRDSVVGRGIESYALASRLSAVLSRQLVDAGSPVIKALRGALKTEPGLSDVPAATVAGWFADLLGGTAPSAPVEVTGASAPLAPGTVAKPAEPVVGRPASGQWDEPSFFAKLLDERGAAELEVARRVFEWANSPHLDIWWGKGAITGSFFPGFVCRGKWNGLVSLWTNGRVELQLLYLGTRPPFDREEKRSELLGRLSGVSGLILPSRPFERLPTLKLSALQDEASLKALLTALDWVVQEATAATT